MVEALQGTRGVLRFLQVVKVRAYRIVFSSFPRQPSILPDVWGILRCLLLFMLGESQAARVPLLQTGGRAVE